jgi:hypothetical protein
MLMMNYLLDLLYEVFQEYQQLDDYYVDFQDELDDHANEPKKIKKRFVFIDIHNKLYNNILERFELHEFDVQLLI